MKVKEKELLKQELINFLEKENLLLKNASYFMSQGVKFQLRTNSEESQSSYYIDDLLFECKFNKIEGRKYLFQFVEYLLDKPETQNLALIFLNLKEVSARSSDYEDNVKEVLLALKNKPNIYFDYIGRTKFLESNIRNINSFFEVITELSKRQAILEKCFSLKTFTSLDVQTLLYNTVQTYMKEKDMYDDFFPNIQKIEEETNLFSEVFKEERVKFKFDINRLNSVNLNKKYQINGLKNLIKNLLKNIEEIEPNLYNITSTMYEEEKDSVIISLFGKNLNQQKIEYFFNMLLMEKLKQDGDTYGPHSEGNEELINYNVKKSDAKFLNDTLGTNNIVKKKNKI